MKLEFCAALISLSLAACACSRNESPSGSDVPATSPRQLVQAEGTVDGGGGKGVLCGSRLVTLDRFEAERNFGSAVRLDSETVDEALIAIGDRFAKHTGTQDTVPMNQWTQGSKVRLLKQWKNSIGVRLRPIPAGARLVDTTDATLPKLPATCSFVQLAIYEKDGTIKYDTDYWARLEPIDIAVLYAHEYFYAEFRKNGYKTSDETRAMISQLLANKLKPMFQDLWSKPDFLNCDGGGSIPGTSFEVFLSDSNAGSPVLSLYFRRLGDTVVYTETHGEMLGLTTEDFLNPKNWLSSQFTVREAVFGTPWLIEIQLNPMGTSPAGHKEILFRAYRSGEPAPQLVPMLCRVQKQRAPDVP